MKVPYSPEVAWWFATHNWDGVYQSGEGVIYRINKGILEETLDTLVKQMKQEKSAYQLIDISKSTHAVPNELTPRPVAQVGLTVVGNEAGEVLLRLIQRRGITAYVFQRDHTAYPRSTESIKPVDDPLESFLSQARDGFYDNSWQEIVNILYRRSDCKCTFTPDVTDLRIKTAVFKGYDGLKKLTP